MMWADRTAIGLSGITAVAIALTLVIDRLSYNPFLTTNETTVTTVRLKPGSEEWLDCRARLTGGTAQERLGYITDSAGRYLDCEDVPGSDDEAFMQSITKPRTWLCEQKDGLLSP
jgi:hypothetical protein